MEQETKTETETQEQEFDVTDITDHNPEDVPLAPSETEDETDYDEDKWNELEKNLDMALGPADEEKVVDIEFG